MVFTSMMVGTMSIVVRYFSIASLLNRRQRILIASRECNTVATTRREKRIKLSSKLFGRMAWICLIVLNMTLDVQM